MGRVSRLLLLIMLVMTGPLRAQDNSDAPDLREYIKYIRDLGMSEGAQMALGMVAGVRIGSQELFFSRDSLGSYGMGFRSLTCMRPGADDAAVRAMRQEMEQKRVPEMANLRWLADADSSGFVSTAEATELRRLVEFGYRASHVASAENNAAGTMCRALSLTEDGLRATMSDYARLQEKARKGKIQPFPEVAIQ